MTAVADDVARAVSLEALSLDPYPTYAALRRDQPVAWIPALKMWWVTRYDDVRAVLLNTDDFVTGTEASLLQATFGEHMLTTEGERHARYRDPRLNRAFSPPAIRASTRASIDARVAQLLDPLIADGGGDLRQALASRLPVLVMLDLFGLPDHAEPAFRAWYDTFEQALSDHGGTPDVRARAGDGVTAFHGFLQAAIDAERRGRGRPGLLAEMLARPDGERLADDEIRRNALIILFGGISTVEAVILNTLWALLTHPPALARVRAQRDLLDAAFDETMRWMAPVQSATRHAVRDCEVAGIRIPAGATVNAMLGSANRDETVFDDAAAFRIERPNARKHLGFATGPHFCLGRHLAREEALAVATTLLDRAPSLALAKATAPRGHEFRQPPELLLKLGA